MTDIPTLRSSHEKEWEARRLADEGYGWEDLVVRCGLSRDWARRIVIEQWNRKQQAERNNG